MTIKRDSLNLTKLFGKDRAQEDENLQHYFIKTKQYDEIKRGYKELVLGRKGAGKSALSIFDIHPAFRKKFTNS
jgi:hypothetical protein